MSFIGCLKRLVSLIVSDNRTATKFPFCPNFLFYLGPNVYDMKQTPYFSHDANAASDPKIVRLIEEGGCEFYGIFWLLVETLRMQEPTYSYPVAALPGLARRYNTTAEKIKAVVGGYNLFSVTEDGQIFFSQSLIDRMQIMEERREKLRVAGSLGGKQKALNEASLKQGCSIALANKVKESKVKEIKIKENKVKDNIDPDGSAPLSSIDYEFIISQYHELCPGMGRVVKLTDARRDLIRVRLKEFGQDKIIETFQIAGKSRFLNGHNDRKWQADFEWILGPKNFIKIIEGRYTEKSTQLSAIQKTHFEDMDNQAYQDKQKEPQEDADEKIERAWRRMMKKRDEAAKK